MSSGRIVQIIGAVIDVEFPRDQVPNVYDALVVDDKGLTLEVQQQLGDGVVRAIAMGSSEGISRGLGVNNTAPQFQFLWEPKPWDALWMCWATRLTKKARSVKKSVWLFTASRQPMMSWPRPTTCWKQASR